MCALGRVSISSMIMNVVHVREANATTFQYCLVALMTERLLEMKHQFSFKTFTIKALFSSRGKVKTL